jgi:hypothetical protein
MGLEDPLATVDRIAGISGEEKKLIQGKNAARLLHID